MSAGAAGRVVARRVASRASASRLVAGNAAQVAQTSRNISATASRLRVLAQTSQAESLSGISEALTTIAEEAKAAAALATNPNIARMAHTVAVNAEVASGALQRLASADIAVIERNMPRVQSLIDSTIGEADALASQATVVADQTALIAERTATAAAEAELKAARETKRLITIAERDVVAAEGEAAQAERLTGAARRELQRRVAGSETADLMAAAEPENITLRNRAISLRQEANAFASDVTIAETNLANAEKIQSVARAKANELAAKLAGGGAAGIGVVISDQANVTVEPDNPFLADYRLADTAARQANERLAEAQKKVQHNGASLDNVVALVDAENAAKAAQADFSFAKYVYNRARVIDKRLEDRANAGMNKGEMAWAAFDIVTTPPIPHFDKVEEYGIDPLMDHVVFPLVDFANPNAHLIAEVEKQQQQQQQEQKGKEDRLEDWHALNEMERKDEINTELSNKVYPSGGSNIPYEKPLEQRPPPRNTLLVDAEPNRSESRNAKVWAAAAGGSDSCEPEDEEAMMSVDPTQQLTSTSGTGLKAS